MTLDIIVWAPEVFFLFQLLVLVWYGSGPLDTPRREKVYLLKGMNETSSSFADKFLSKKGGKAVSGPLHIQSHLNAWVATLCLLMVALLWKGDLNRLMPGSLFSRDSGTALIVCFLWTLAAIFLLLQNPWQKWAGIVHLEYFYLTLLFLFGVHLLCYRVDLIALYLSLELQSFSVVVLCQLNYNTPQAIEAGMKYFLLRAFSSRLLLLGIGLIYSQTAHTDLSSIQELLMVLERADFSSQLGGWLIGLGLLWKLAQAPLHMWAADVYMGAWTSVTLMISTLPKIQVLYFWAHSFHSIWSYGFGRPLLRFFRRCSFIIGRLAPLAQSNLKRLLAFSSVGNMGLLLMPFRRGSQVFTQRLWVHLFLYILSSMIAWGLIMWPFYRSRKGATYVSGPQYIWDLANLNQISPAQAQAWAISMLSFQGLPPVQGFLGKLFLFWSSLRNNMYVLICIALLSTLVSCVYYLRVIKLSYVDQPNSWGTYGPFRPSQAYVIQVAVSLLLLLMWHVQPLVLQSHLLALAVS